MRRTALRLAAALLATSLLAACADVPTGPEAPRAPRAEISTDSVSKAPSNTSRCGSVQGSQTCF